MCAAAVASGVAIQGKPQQGQQLQHYLLGCAETGLDQPENSISVVVRQVECLNVPQCSTG